MKEQVLDRHTKNVETNSIRGKKEVNFVYIGRHFLFRMFYARMQNSIVLEMSLPD